MIIKYILIALLKGLKIIILALADWTILGLFLSFFGSGMLVAESISTLQGKSKSRVFKDIKGNTTRYELENGIPNFNIKITRLELRMLIWLFLLSIGFLLQLIGYSLVN